MITEIKIENFKSIASLTFKPGRVTVLIGENGSGKSNILEAIAFGAGAAGNKLEREFLYSRGIRVSDAEWMRSAFVQEEDIRLCFGHSETKAPLNYSIKTTYPNDSSSIRWLVRTLVADQEIPVHSMPYGQLQMTELVMETLRRFSEVPSTADANAVKGQIEAIVAEAVKLREMNEFVEAVGLTDFLIYAPENTVLRAFDPEGAIEPLGSRGEGLLKLLQSFGDARYQNRFTELKECLCTLGWFEDLLLPTAEDTFRDRIRIKDGLLPPERSIFDQRNANEGFLLLLFYFVLFLSRRTPKFFAIDNIDTALNPKLCATLMRQLAALADKYDKQVIFTTHNPAILDGLDLNDDEQRLFTVFRNEDGHTKVKRVSPPRPPVPGRLPLKLSEAFLQGLLGGLPKHF